MLAAPDYSTDLLSSLVLLSVIGIAAGAYLVRAWIAGRARYERVDQQAEGALLGKAMMEGAYWSIQPLARAALRLGLSPNRISWLSGALALLSGGCLAVGHFGFGGIFAVLSAILDALDGLVARSSGTASNAGEVLDASVDRYGEFFILAGLAIHYRERPALLVAVLFSILGSFMVSYASAKAEIFGVTLGSRSMRRPERAVLVALGALLSPLSIPILEPGVPWSQAVGHPMAMAVCLLAALTQISAVERLVELSRALLRKPEVRDHEPVPNRSISPLTNASIRDREARHLAPGLQGFAQWAGISVESASGCRIRDVEGRSYIDWIGGIGVGGIGHSHPRWVEAVQKQAARVAVGSFASEARASLLERLSRLRPHHALHRAQFYSSGTEAVESALRLAKAHTGRDEFVSFWGAFHGKTQGALALMGSDFKNQLGPMPPGTHLVPYASCYRCPLALSYPSCGLKCVDLARRQARMSSSGRVAAVIVEPMQGTAGNVIPPPEFLPAVKELARELGALLIVDEMITGFGRTGRLWGSWHSGVEPDIVTVGKQFGGGFPISAILSTDEITAAAPWSQPSGSSSSYGGNPLAAAAADAALAVIEEEKLVENSRVMGDLLLQKLKTFEQRFSFVGEVRGKGLLLALELVENRRTRKPLGRHSCRRLFDLCLARGLLTMSYAPQFRIQPPMVIDRETIEESLQILESAFAAFESEQTHGPS